MNRQNILARKWAWKLGFHPTMWLPNEIMNEEEFTLVLLEYYWEMRKNSNCIYNITNTQKHRAAWKPFGTMVLHGVPHVSIIGTITHFIKKNSKLQVCTTPATIARRRYRKYISLSEWSPLSWFFFYKINRCRRPTLTWNWTLIKKHWQNIS